MADDLTPQQLANLVNIFDSRIDAKVGEYIGGMEARVEEVLNNLAMQMGIAGVAELLQERINQQYEKFIVDEYNRILTSRQQEFLDTGAQTFPEPLVETATQPMEKRIKNV